MSVVELAEARGEALVAARAVGAHTVEVAHLNPVTYVLELARQATVSGLEPSAAHTWPGLLALAGMFAALGALALVGLRRLDR